MRTGNKIQIFTFILLIVAISDLLIYGGSINGCDNRADECEKIFVHLDKTVYVAGENIHYKVYVVNGKSPLQVPESKILYFALSEHNSGKQILWRVNLSKSTLNGSYQLSESMNAGVYELAVYTNLIRESIPENIFSQELFILNLAIEIPDSIYIHEPNAVNDSKIRTVNDDQPNLRLHASKAVYSTNDKVALKITVDNLNLNDTAYLSLSVTNEIPFKGILHNASIIEQFNRFGDFIDRPCLSGLENYAYILNGRVSDKNNGSPIRNAKIFLALVDSVSPKVMYSAADSDGNFRLYLNQFYDNKEIILQLADDSGNIDILWDLQQKGIPYTGSSDISLPLSNEQMAFLNQTKDVRLIEAVYSERMISKKVIPGISGVSYFACPDIIIFPDDYAEMANFREITDNIIPQLRLRNRRDNYYLEVYNDSKGTLSENNLVLLNGVPFSDINYIATLGTRDIKKIEIINSGSFIAGDIRYNAVISIYTHNVRLPESYLKAYTMIFLNTVTGTNEVNDSDEYSVPVRTRAHFPDFRNSLYWNPELKVSGNNTITLEFTTSQLEGEYHAEIQGITSSGIPLNESISFSVK
ncbi:MAG: hypothetical protein JW894_12095 [Bacteroidales bacterium]|nr:hypothetical protein [Bacteroidales bacterium]